MAFRVSDGREMWRWAGDAPAVGASPVIGTIASQVQLVFKTMRHIAGFDPLSGKELWRIPYKVPTVNTIVTPLLIGDLLVTSDDDLGAKAWRIEREGGRWRARELWGTRDVSLFMNSPVLVAGVVMGFSQFRKGQLFLMDPARGEVVWCGPPRSGEHAAILAWGDQALVFSEDGFLAVGAVKQRAFHLLRRYRLGDSGAWAHPAVAGNRIVVKNGTRLAVYEITGQ